MSALRSFCKACPENLRLYDRPNPYQEYKYFVAGKGSVLGVLFEDSINVYFEWLREDGRVVDYPPELRYRAWSKREVARMLHSGYWEVTTAALAA